MGKRGGWTAASLRAHYRYQISQIDGMDRQGTALIILNQMLAKNAGWTLTQIRAVAEGLELGMNEGIR
jgi:hypothetical protein